MKEFQTVEGKFMCTGGSWGHTERALCLSVLCAFLGECTVLKHLFQGAGVALLCLDIMFLIFICIFDYLVLVG